MAKVQRVWAVSFTVVVAMQLLAFGSAADDENPVSAETPESQEVSGWSVGGNLQLLGTIVPGKWGGYFERVWDGESVTHLSFAQGTLSLPGILSGLAEVSDTNIVLSQRSRIGEGKTSWFYGLSYNRFSGRVGDSILGRITGSSVPSLNLIEIETVGLVVGIVTRWKWQSGLQLDLEWFSWNQPLAITKNRSDALTLVTNSSDRNSLDEATKVLTRFPIFNILKLGLGYTF